MAVYREGYHAVNEIQKASIPIYPDACDFGAPTKKGDKIWKIAGQLVSQYAVEGTRKEYRYATGRSSSAVVSLLDEWAVSDGFKTPAQARDLFNIEYTSCTSGACNGFDGYITVTKVQK